ncbi:hypothetical protein [Mangrovibacterium diazotrophicum]|uniref:hypothetical protein n=1 Tax=Mangrovibacterium diazotrophicum TaxID=1261403 RepID=UPI000E70C4FC|nr:hypothetical protein [Mangrovibacterium diazotrophicum]
MILRLTLVIFLVGLFILSYPQLIFKVPLVICRLLRLIFVTVFLIFCFRLVILTRLLLIPFKRISCRGQPDQWGQPRQSSGISRPAAANNRKNN